MYRTNMRIEKYTNPAILLKPTSVNSLSVCSILEEGMGTFRSYGNRDQWYCNQVVPFYIFLEFDKKEASHYQHHCTNLEADLDYFQKT